MKSALLPGIPVGGKGGREREREREREGIMKFTIRVPEGGRGRITIYYVHILWNLRIKDTLGTI